MEGGEGCVFSTSSKIILGIIRPCGEYTILLDIRLNELL